MLQNLHVKNLALIDEAEVEFTPGLNIMTGETGAGKSIIIGSINLALGGKLPKEMIRENAPYGLVELTFKVENEQLKQALGAMDIFPEDDSLILSRKIVNGRSVLRINAETVPISKVKEVASLFIDIHGQHEHQSLLVKKNHLNILDSYAKNRILKTKEKLKSSYESYKKAKDKLESASLNASEREREISFLEYEVNEIEEAHLICGEDEQLELEYRRLLHGQKILEAVSLAYEKTSEGFDSATNQISYALKQISSVSEYDEPLTGFENQLIEIDSLLNDFNRELADYISDTSFDEETFAEVEHRLDEVNRLKAKYGKTIEEILTSLEEKKARLTALELTEAIKKELVDLNFLEVSFSMNFNKLNHYTANGYDDAEFLISTNLGEPEKSLEKVASGGELSRIMLAIKTVLAEIDAVDTLIFDEIDTGISGRTAQMVSEKMNLLGRSHQVICITHLPQIAAMADSHYLIEKSVSNQTTISTIRALEEKECVGELARMIGGVKITDTVMKSAGEMKELAANTKKTLGELS